MICRSTGFACRNCRQIRPTFLLSTRCDTMLCNNCMAPPSPVFFRCRFCNGHIVVFYSCSASCLSFHTACSTTSFAARRLQHRFVCGTSFEAPRRSSHVVPHSVVPCVSRCSVSSPRRRCGVSSPRLSARYLVTTCRRRGVSSPRVFGAAFALSVGAAIVTIEFLYISSFFLRVSSLCM